MSADDSKPALGSLPFFKSAPSKKPNYDPALVQPMRDELTRLGVEELLTPEAVDEAIARDGRTLVFVNSVCGCAAGGARPAIARIMDHPQRPDHVVTVFAGMEHEAVARARAHFAPYPASSPQIALLEAGKVLAMWERQDIEGREPEILAEGLGRTFAEHG